MKRSLVITCWLLWFLLAGSLPAYANPIYVGTEPIWILLIFPVAILAYRFSDATFTEKERKRRILCGIGLGVCYFLTVPGGIIALIPLLILLCYGLRRGTLACIRGQGWKRFVFGSVVIVFTIVVIANYFLQYYSPG